MHKYLTSCLLLLVLLSTSLSNAANQVKVGAKVLAGSGFAQLRGKQVGLVTNHTSMVDEEHLVDVMQAEGVRLRALFSPEHGIRGEAEDGVKIGEQVDKDSDVPVYSLYGNVKKPTPEMLQGIDLLLYDIQGVGVRFYTYISTMGHAMQAAAEAGIPFVILDRPNPLGGDYFAGFVLEEGFRSFVGEYPIPVAHGMTAGELALMIKGERMFAGLQDLDLRVIRMEGWQRNALWPETGLAWTKTSPNIPDFETAILYAGMCFFEGTAASVGRGTREPFRVVGLPGINASALAGQLNAKNLAGVRFDAVQFMPRSIPGMSSQPRLRNRTLPGVRLVITDPDSYRTVETGIHLLCALYASLGEKERERFFQTKGFDLLAGTDRLRRLIQTGTSAEEIIAAWQKENERFAEIRMKYLLY